MNIAVLGKSWINNSLLEQLESEGFTPLLFQNIEDIKSVRGEKGAFIIKSPDGSFQASHIIITEEPSIYYEEYCKNPIYSDLGNIIKGKEENLLQDNTVHNILNNDIDPAVFVLDYPSESSILMFRTALEKAIQLARKKRKTIFLSRFMKTAGDSLESLYKYARNLGIVFLKYDNIEVEYLDTQKMYQIVVADMYNSLKILTPAPIFARERICSDNFLKVIKLLKLKLDSKNHINEDKFFLFPWLTSRKGVYFTSLNSFTGSSEELMTIMQYIISDIKGALNGADRLVLKESEQYAQVDKEKCAFCYTCYRACPHFAMTPDNENSVMKSLMVSCYGCGICYSVCPAHAITMVNKTEEDSRVEEKPAYRSQMQSENRSDKDSSDKNRSNNFVELNSLKIFCCENSGEIALSKIARKLKEDGIKIDITPVACGGELSSEGIIEALKDFSKVIVAICIDDACRHFEGNKRAKRHVERAKNMLKSSGIDENRIIYLQLSHSMYVELDERVREEFFHDCC
jgi:Pyruvate/2-oxoacid:ferredoxin oxidoreductase delta subunit/coenzyme F420-reducing hydrogenase delta subunit